MAQYKYGTVADDPGFSLSTMDQANPWLESSVGGGVSDILNDICSSLDTTEYKISSSRQMVEGGSRGLRDHLNGSPVTVTRASHNETSRTSFYHHGLGLDTSLFVLYVFPVDTPAPAAPIVSQPLVQATVADRRSRSRTPAGPRPSARSSVSSFLANLLKMTGASDQRFLEDGHSLAALVNINNVTKYGTAYLQIRQVLMIESVFSQG
ncbi:hypothetical protein B0H13DRAFT_1881949 [Mycena leptocephala]|nr:hypothetical protein B0H13DRAFT_1881949 [Mycena leptocephala]